MGRLERIIIALIRRESASGVMVMTYEVYIFCIILLNKFVVSVSFFIFELDWEVL